MRIDKRIDVLNLLFRAFNTPYCFYLIGAGASAGIIQMTHNIGDNIIDRFLSFGIYRTETCEIDDIFIRIIGNPYEYKDPFKLDLFQRLYRSSIHDVNDYLLKLALLRRLYPSAVHAMLIKELTPSISLENVHGYEIFSFFKKPSTIFSMNVDGLAARYCIGHHILEPHGRVPTKLVHSPLWEDVIDSLIQYGFEAPKIPNLLLPKPEPSYVTSQEAYKRAIPLFQSSKFFIVIGYSFGLFGQSIDDIETFEFFRELFKHHTKEIIVINPNAKFVSSIIEEAACQSKINLLPLYWNHFCKAVIELANLYKCNSLLEMKSLAKRILYRHDELKEINS